MGLVERWAEFSAKQTDAGKARLVQKINESEESLKQKNEYRRGKDYFQKVEWPHVEAYRAHEEKYLLKAVGSLLSEAIDKDDIRLVVIARETLKNLMEKPKTDVNFEDLWAPELMSCDWTK
jgi:hypothetical protein